MSLFSCTTDREIVTENKITDPNSQLVYYWNFNTLTAGSTVDNLIADYNIPTINATLTYSGVGDGYMDSFTPGYNLNIRNNETEVSGLRVRNPSDTRSLILTMPTSGFKQIVVKFATAKTSTGATTQKYSYTLDGTTYINSGLNVSSYNPSVDPASELVTLDFSTISGVNDNPNFKIKIDFEGVNASGTTGNNRFDNITLEGYAL